MVFYKRCKGVDSVLLNGGRVVIVACPFIKVRANGRV